METIKRMLKYILISLAAFAFCISAGIIITKLILRKNRSRPLRIFCALLFSVIALLGVLAGYFSVYYHADERAMAALESTDTVSVTRIHRAWQFDGPGTECAFVFCPGAKVQAEAYAPLMKELSEQGLDCVLLDPPFRFALFDPKDFERALEIGTYTDRYIGGHSLGGVTASSCASSHPDKISGLILLGAYPGAAVPQRLLLIRGSEDGILVPDDFEQSRKFWPVETVDHVIEGGNHSGFACYGLQRGDQPAQISPEQQQEETAAEIISFINRQN